MLFYGRGEKIRFNTISTAEEDGLYPLQALIQPVSLRFKYHFEGNRQTNRLDKAYISYFDVAYLIFVSV
jgi:hypothetical protein